MSEKTANEVVPRGDESEEAVADVRPTPVADRALLTSINNVLDSLPERTATAVLQVPEDGKLKAGVYVNVGHGFSFMGWLDKDLKAKAGIGYGVAVRKKW